MTESAHPDIGSRVEILEQLHRILNSSDFCRSERLRNFLSFVVEELIAGRSHRLKAYTIALAVFDRPPSFDPQADPLVRIEATRLRRALEHYYLTEGKSDPLVISVPRGAYVPRITPRTGELEAPEILTTPASPVVSGVADTRMLPRVSSTVGMVVAVVVCLFGGAVTALVFGAVGFGWNAASTKASASAPGLAVLPFRAAGVDGNGQQVTDGLDEQLIDQLVKLGDVRVLGREASRVLSSSSEPATIAERHHVRFFVEGSVTAQGGRLSVSVRLVDFDHRQVVWATRIPMSVSVDVATAQTEIATAIARTLAQPYGALYRLDSAHSGQPVASSRQNESCLSRYYAYRLAITAESNRAIRNCINAVTERKPQDATAWAMLAIVRLDNIRFGFNPEEPLSAVVSDARAAAERAVALEPDNIRGLQALMLARFFAGDIEGGRVAGDRALEINPDDTEVLSEYGARLAQMGEWARGSRMLEAALMRAPPNAGVLHGHAAFALLMEGRTEEAVAHLRRMSTPPHPSVLFVRMLVEAESGDLKAARSALSTLNQSAPNFIADLDKQISVRNIPVADLDRVKSIVRKVQSTTVATHVE